MGISCVKYSLGSNWKPLLVGEGPKPCETGDGYCEQGQLPRLLFQSRRWLTPSGHPLPASLRLAQHRLTRDHRSRDLFAFTGGQHASRRCPFVHLTEMSPLSQLFQCWCPRVVIARRGNGGRFYSGKVDFEETRREGEGWHQFTSSARRFSQPA